MLELKIDIRAVVKIVNAAAMPIFPHKIVFIYKCAGRAGLECNLQRGMDRQRETLRRDREESLK